MEGNKNTFCILAVCAVQRQVSITSTDSFNHQLWFFVFSLIIYEIKTIETFIFIQLGYNNASERSCLSAEQQGIEVWDFPLQFSFFIIITLISFNLFQTKFASLSQSRTCVTSTYFFNSFLIQHLITRELEPTLAVSGQGQDTPQSQFASPSQGHILR